MPRKRKRSSAAYQREQLRAQNNSLNEETESSQRNSELTTYAHKSGAYKIISGTLHQGDTRFQYPGIQCAFISLIALIRMTIKDPKSWTSGHIDSCVIEGNAKFLKHCEELHIPPKMLMANELPNEINLSHKSYAFHQTESEVEVGLL